MNFCIAFTFKFLLYFAVLNGWPVAQIFYDGRQTIVANWGSTLHFSAPLKLWEAIKNGHVTIFSKLIPYSRCAGRLKNAQQTVRPIFQIRLFNMRGQLDIFRSMTPIQDFSHLHSLIKQKTTASISPANFAHSKQLWKHFWRGILSEINQILIKIQWTFFSLFAIYVSFTEYKI